MQIPGRVKNGVVILEGGPPLPNGAAVIVLFDVPSVPEEPVARRVPFPLVHSKNPCSVRLTSQRVAELLDEEEVST